MLEQDITARTSGAGSYTLLATPEKSDWECQIIQGYVFVPTKGNEPNWFWRKMQHLMFGFKWVKRSANG